MALVTTYVSRSSCFSRSYSCSQYDRLSQQQLSFLFYCGRCKPGLQIITHAYTQPFIFTTLVKKLCALFLTGQKLWKAARSGDLPITDNVYIYICVSFICTVQFCAYMDSLLWAWLPLRTDLAGRCRSFPTFARLENSYPLAIPHYTLPCLTQAKLTGHNKKQALCDHEFRKRSHIWRTVPRPFPAFCILYFTFRKRHSV